MLATIKNLFLFFRDFMGVRIRCGFFDIVAKDSSSPAVSCLNFEPSVSKFPRDWAKSLENRRKHYKILKQDFIVLFSLIN